MNPADPSPTAPFPIELDLDRIFGIAVHLTGGDRGRAGHLVERAAARLASDSDSPAVSEDEHFLTAVVQLLVEDMGSVDEPGPELEEAPQDPRHARLKKLDPQGRFLRRIPGSVVAGAIDELPTRFRVPLVLSDVAGLGGTEIARLLGTPRGTVSSRLFRARRSLERRLLEYCREHVPPSGDGR